MVGTIGHPCWYNKAIKNRGTQNLWKTKIRVATYRQGEMPERIYYEDHRYDEEERPPFR